MNKTRVLAVDDEESVRLSIEESLKENFQVTTVANGEDAIKSIANEKPDLVLLDIMLPGIDGIETLKKIKEFDANIHVVMISVIDRLNVLVKAMRMGADYFYSKPFDAFALNIIIRNILSNKLKMENFLDSDIMIMHVREKLLSKNLTLDEAVREFRKEYIHSVFEISRIGSEKMSKILGVDEKVINETMH